MIKFVWNRLNIWIVFLTGFWLTWGLFPYFIQSIPKLEKNELIGVLLVSSGITGALLIDSIRDYIKKRKAE